MPYTAQNGRRPATATNLKSHSLDETSKGTADQFTDCIVNALIPILNLQIHVYKLVKVRKQHLI